MRSNIRSASPARIAALWLGVQLTWGAILGVALQAKCAQFGGASALSLVAHVSISGAIAAAITQLIAGPWSDRVQRARNSRSAFYIAGISSGAIAAVAFFIAPDAQWLTAAFIALQISLNVAIAPYQAIVPETMSDERIGLGSAWIAGMQSAGNAIGAVLASMLGATLLLGIILAVALLATAAVTIAHVRAIVPRERVATPFAFRAAFADLFISRAFVYVGFYTLVLYLYFFVQTIVHANATRASGVVILIFTLVGSIGAALAARPSDRADERLVVCAGAGIMALALGALATLHTIALLVLAVIVAGVGWGIFLCADWAIACRILPKHALAGTMAVWNLAVLIPQIVAPAIANTVLKLTGMLHSPQAPAIAILVGGAEMLIGAVWIWRLPGKQVGN